MHSVDDGIFAPLCLCVMKDAGIRINSWKVFLDD